MSAVCFLHPISFLWEKHRYAVYQYYVQCAWELIPWSWYQYRKSHISTCGVPSMHVGIDSSMTSLKGRAKRKTVSLERLSTELSGALRDRWCAWSKDLSPTQQGTDRPFPPSTKDWEVLKPPKNSWRDHWVKSARKRGKVPSQSQSGDERYHDAPPPTVSNRKDAQLSTMVCKRDDGSNHQSENFAQACRYLPRSLESSFSKKKKEKKGG
jgi:hypothetical protein